MGNLQSPISNLLRQHKIEAVALLLILLVAGWLRLGWPGVNSFGFDEARVSDMALQMAREGRFAALGMQSSTGVPNFAATVWFFALPYAVSTNPLVASSLVGLLNSLAALGVWWLGREAWGKRAGLLAALLFATSPYLVFYSRSVWSQNLLAPLAVLWAVALVSGLKRGNPWLIGLHAFLAGFVGQIHFAGFALALASLWCGFRFRLWRWWGAVTAGLVIAGLMALPTITIIWRDGDGAKAVLRELFQSGGTATAVDQTAAWSQLAQLGLNRGWETLWLRADWAWPGPLAAGLQAGGTILAGLILLGAGLAGWQMAADLRRAWRREAAPLTGREILSGFVLVWAVAAPLLFLSPRSPVHIQYQLVSLPALLLLAGGATALWRGRGWTTAVSLLVIVTAGFQGTAVARTLSLVAEEYVPGGMGTPLRYPQAAARGLMDGRPIVVETFGDVPEFDGDAAAFKVLLWGYPSQIVDARQVLLLPDEPAHLLFTYDNLAAWEVATAVGPSGQIQALPRRVGEMPYLALTVDEVDLRGFMELERPLRLANGAELQGWQVQELPDRGQIRLITHWRIVDSPQEGHFQQFNHLYLEGDETPGDIRDIYTSSRSWQMGDHLITWADFPRPERPIAHFHVGMYTWPDLQRSPILNRPDMAPLYPIELTVNS